MTEFEKMNLLIEAANLSFNHYGEPRPRVLEIFGQLYGQEELKEIIESDNPNKHIYFDRWDSHIQTEIKNQNLSNAEAKITIDKIIISTQKHWMLISLIEKSVEEGEFPFAESIIPGLPAIEDSYGPYQYMAHRKFLRHFAKAGNLEEFKKRLKLSKPARGGLANDKILLIENYSKSNGFEKGLEICKDKILGEKFCMSTIKWMAHLIELKQIDDILIKYPVYTNVEPNAKPILYVSHFDNQRLVVISPNEFTLVLNETLLIDKSIRMGDGRLRDGLLCNLASSTKDVNQINECKRNIIDPFYKRELNYHLKNIKAL